MFFAYCAGAETEEHGGRSYEKVYACWYYGEVGAVGGEVRLGGIS